MPLPAAGYAIGIFLRSLLGKAAAAVYAFVIWLWPWILEKGIALLGVGLLTFTGFDILQTQVEDQVFTHLQGVSADIYQILMILKIDVGLKILFSCMAAGITVKTTFAGSRLIFGKSTRNAQP